MGIPWNCIGDSWMGGCHGYLSMASSCGDHHGHPMELHWGLLDGWMPWISFHGKLMWRSPWASHGIALGTPGWVDAMDICPWQAHVEITMGIPWNCIGDSWMGGCHGYLSMASSCGDHHGHP